MKFLFFKISFILFILFCNPSTREDNKDNLRVGISSDPTTLDPIFSVDLTSQKINSLLFSKLFRFKKDGSIEGDLVKEFNQQGKFLSIKLKQFESANGVSLNARDVLYSLNRLKTEKGPRKSRYSFIESIQVISNLELKIEFDSNSKKYLGLLALAPASIYQETEHKNTGDFKSSGLFFLKRWNKNESIELGLNQVSNRQEKTTPNGLVLQVLNQPSSAIYLFEKNKLDVMKIPYFLLLHPSVKNKEKRIVKGKSLQYIAINHNNPCFDLSFRKALNLSVNRKLIIEKIFDSYASEVNATVTNEYLELFTNEKFFYNYDLELARKNLQESKCYPAILDKPIELRMRADDENKAKGAVLAQSFKELGLKVNVLPMEKTKLYKENSEKKGDLTLLTWYIDYDSVVNFIDPILASDSFGSAGNRSFYSNPKVDEFIKKVRKNPDENLDIVQIIKEIKEDSPLVFLWSIHENYILSKKANEYPDLLDLLVQ